MAGFSRNIKVVHGIVQVDAKLTSTSQKEEGFVQLCTGAGTHDPTKPKWDPQCPHCGTVGRDTLAKGSEVAKDTYVVFDASEVTDLKSDDEAYKGAITLSAHEATEVEGQLMPSGTVYYLSPGKGDRNYGLLKLMVEENPDLAYIGIYTVSSKAALYRVRPYQGVLVMEQLLWPENVLTVPQFDSPEVPEVMVEVVRDAARKFVTPFDAAAYRNTYADRLAEAVAAREATGGAGVAPAPLPAGKAKADPMADTLAALAAMVQQGAQSAPAGKKAPKAKAKVS